MELIGIDLDNTLIEYDIIFAKIAEERGVIPSWLQKTKVAIRDYLNNNNKGSIFTEIQAEVYGKRMVEANPAKNSLEVLIKLRKEGYKIIIISHKTRYPITGGETELRELAKEWLSKHGYFDNDKIDLEESQVYFEETQEEKIDRINNSGCNIFVDDLEKILRNVNGSIKRIHYTKETERRISNIIRANNWNEVYQNIKRN